MRFTGWCMWARGCECVQMHRLSVTSTAYRVHMSRLRPIHTASSRSTSSRHVQIASCPHPHTRTPPSVHMHSLIHVYRFLHMHCLAILNRVVYTFHLVQILRLTSTGTAPSPHALFHRLSSACIPSYTNTPFRVHIHRLINISICTASYLQALTHLHPHRLVFICTASCTCAALCRYTPRGVHTSPPVHMHRFAPTSTASCPHAPPDVYMYCMWTRR